jgi:hypothetical protein
MTELSEKHAARPNRLDSLDGGPFDVFVIELLN